MNRQELLAAILSTRADGRMSSTEKRALRQVVLEGDWSVSTLSAVRHDVFEALAEGDGMRRLDVLWLEDVVNLLDPPPPRRAAVTSAAWFGPEDPMVEQLESMVDSARQTLDIAVFTLTDDRLRAALIRAHERGVRVRILSDDDKSRDTGSDIRALQSAGLSVHLDRSRHHFHHKFAVFDGAMLVCGSYNWTRGADRHNRENFLRTGDPVLLDAYTDAFAKMWAELSA